MKEVVLHGDLARFGGPFLLDVMSPSEAVRALCQIEGFREALSVGEYRVAVNDTEIGATDLRLGLDEGGRVNITPVAAGAKRGGVAKVILGAALIAGAFYFAPAVVGAAGPTQGLGTIAIAGTNITYSQIALFGASTLLGGITQLLSPVPSVGDFTQFESAEQRESFLFNGPVNTTEQGGAVPLIFGRAMVGSRVISAGMTAERVPD